MDIFCQKERFEPFIIDESRHLYLLHDAYPLMEGHLLLIPKQHLSCFAELSAHEMSEFEMYRETIRDFHLSHYGASVQFEHGGIVQTVPHAHMHFLPTNTSVQLTLQENAKKVATRKIPYLYFGYMNEESYYEVTKPLQPGYIHTLYRTHLPPYDKDPVEASNIVRRAWRMAFP